MLLGAPGTATSNKKLLVTKQLPTLPEVEESVSVSPNRPTHCFQTCVDECRRESLDVLALEKVSVMKGCETFGLANDSRKGLASHAQFGRRLCGSAASWYDRTRHWLFVHFVFQFRNDFDPDRVENHSNYQPLSENISQNYRNPQQETCSDWNKAKATDSQTSHHGQICRGLGM